MVGKSKVRLGSVTVNNWRKKKSSECSQKGLLFIFLIVNNQVISSTINQNQVCTNPVILLLKTSTQSVLQACNHNRTIYGSHMYDLSVHIYCSPSPGGQITTHTCVQICTSSTAKFRQIVFVQPTYSSKSFFFWRSSTVFSTVYTRVV